jgi:hypothetical protein
VIVPASPVPLVHDPAPLAIDVLAAVAITIGVPPNPVSVGLPLYNCTKVAVGAVIDVPAIHAVIWSSK